MKQQAMKMEEQIKSLLFLFAGSPMWSLRRISAAGNVILSF